MVLMAERKIVRIAVSDDAKNVVTEYSQREGMKEVAVLSRLYERFGSVPAYLQDWLLDKTRPELHTATCKRIAAYFNTLAQESLPAGSNQLEPGPVIRVGTGTQPDDKSRATGLGTGEDRTRKFPDDRGARRQQQRSR